MTPCPATTDAFDTHAGSAPIPGVAITAVILAAGRSSRMGQPKPLLQLGQQSFIATIADTLVGAGVCRSSIAVLISRADVATTAEAARLGLHAHPINSRDRLASIRHAAAVARIGTPKGFRPQLLLAPVDCPAIAVGTVRQLLMEARAMPGHTVVPTYCGRGGHPVLIPAPVMADIEQARCNANLRTIIGAGPVSRVAVNDPHVLDNINTPDDYARLVRTIAHEGERRTRVTA